MGLDPNDDSYPAGSECTVCVDELFGGSTPNMVLAIVQDIKPCPIFPEWAPPIPNGAFCLNQTGPCNWRGFRPDGVSFYWDLLADRSTFRIDWPGWVYFRSTVMDTCYDAFPNDNECMINFAWTFGGYVTIWWGPQICKGPCG